MSDNSEGRKPGLVKTLRRTKDNLARSLGEAKVLRESRAARTVQQKEWRALEARRKAAIPKGERPPDDAAPRRGLVKTLQSAKDDATRAYQIKSALKQSKAAKNVALQAGREFSAEREAVVRREEWQNRFAQIRGDAKALGWVSRVAIAVAAISIIANILMYNRWSNTRPLVQIGPRVVTRGEYYSDLDQEAGKRVLNRIVLSELIDQAANAAGMSPSEADISARLAELRRTHPQGLPADDTPELRKQIGLTLALENLRIQHVKVSDAEVAAFYAANKQQFALPTQMQSLIVASSAADAPRAAKLLHQGQTAAAIAAKPGLHVVGINGFAVNLNSLPPAVGQEITRGLVAMKPGDTKTFVLGRSALTFLMQSRDDAALPALGDIHDQAVRAAKLAKAPGVDQELASLYQAHRPSFDMANYAAYFREFDAPAPANANKKTASLP